MPVYEYHCTDCNSTFDTLVRRLDVTNDVTCTTCSSQNVRRLVSGFATLGGYDDQWVPRQTANEGGGCCGGSCGCHH